ncbi:uncharacterized protein B4U80_05917 [Leptotrombidium deliense]|uniref:MBD domain-containing protein n=1 Tax=Leptotrombidium deliense TaxID=299467 RepID=A0A443SJI3_9ACAR|nr:uncharacterized protein B4U80_05917 [Leptotrombidium deliense]
MFAAEEREEEHCSREASVTVPFEWQRNVIEGRVVYITPSNYVLWSLQEIVYYLQSEGTCKCGLECPLIVSKIFNFDPRLQSKVYNIDECLRDGSTKLCNHRRKNIALATYQNCIFAETPTVGIAPQMLNPNNTGCPQVLQFLNPLHFASVAPSTVTVLQPTPNSDGTTILIPQLMQTADQSVMLGSATTAVIPQIGTPGFASIPVHQPFTMSHTQNINSCNLNSLVKPKAGRSRKKKEGRSSRHPPTVAAILREAEENERRLKEKRQQEEEKAKLELDSRQEVNQDSSVEKVIRISKLKQV